MSVINTNVKSLIVQNAIKVNNRLMSSAMEQLSTGKRINSAKDDAAGLAVSENMTAQIRGLNMAVRNANDGISLLQTAEGAMIEQTNMLQRMRELSVQASNGTLSDVQRGYLNVEFNSLLSEVNRIGNNTQWNNMRLLTGRMGINGDGDVGFQVGAGTTPTETIFVNIGRISAFANKGETVELTNPFDPLDAGTSIDLEVNGVAVSYTQSNSDESVIDVANGLAHAINTNAALAKTVVATVDEDGKLSVLSRVPGPDGTDVTVTTPANYAGLPYTASAVAEDPDNLSLLGDFTQANINDPGSAADAINRVDVALDAIAKQRAVIGAGINRLTYASDNLSNISQNTSESRSRILDTDYAQATTELARTQIIQQASTAVLAQANAQPQSVLKLLQG